MNKMYSFNRLSNPIPVLIMAAFFATACAEKKSTQTDPPATEPPAKQADEDVGLEPTEMTIAVFADPNLEACVRGAEIREGDNRYPVDRNQDGRIQLEEAAALKSLSCQGRAIRDLSGIEQLSGLEYLNCSANELGSMPELSKLPNLNTLRCVNNFFSDADCTELRELQAKGLELLEIEAQRDGRMLTCDQIELKRRIVPQASTFRIDPETNRMREYKNSANDVWGFIKDGVQYGVYGDVTHVHIVRITDAEPYLEKVISMPRGEKTSEIWKHANHSIWGEYRYFEKDGKAYIYASSEGNPSVDKADWPYLQIFDVTDLENKNVKEIEIADRHIGLHSAHNITLDAERELLFLFGGTMHQEEKYKAWDGARIYSLANPEAPQYIDTLGDLYVHDGQIKTVLKDDGTVESSKLYLAQGAGNIHWDANVHTNRNNRIGIWDLAKVDFANYNREHAVEILDQQYPYGYCHNIWVTEDDTHIVVTGETSVDNQLSFWELVPNADGTMKAEFRDGENLQGGAMAHNAFVVGNNIYVSHYTKGVQVFEMTVNRTTQKRQTDLIWSYDTYPQSNSGDYNGVWGVFAFTGNKNTFIATDSSSGLFMFKKSDRFKTLESTPRF